MSGREDNSALILRARVPLEFSTTGDIFPEGERGLVTMFSLTAAAANATAILRDGGVGGTIIWSISAPIATSVPVPFPWGLSFQDGLHLTLAGAGATFNVAATSEESPTP